MFNSTRTPCKAVSSLSLSGALLQSVVSVGSASVACGGRHADIEAVLIDTSHARPGTTYVHAAQL